MSQHTEKPNRGGRPPKFQEPRRPITLTLPERTLAQLALIDSDRARAIVKSVDAVSEQNSTHPKKVELVEMVHKQCLIVVGPCKALRKISWLKLVEIAPARFLLAIPSGTAIETLEVAVMDLLEHEDVIANEIERTTLEELRDCIGRQRRGRKMSKMELLLVSTV